MSELWNIPKKNNVEYYSKLYNTKHGMFAGVPIICRGPNCPYKDVCIVDDDFIEVGTRCQMEAAAVIARFDSWCKHFNIDVSENKIREEDLVDASLIRDLVENEIQMLRAENRIAINSDIVGETISEIDRKCNVYKEDVIRPEAQFKLQLQDKRYKILNLLNSTRKDKAKNLKDNNPSTKSIEIMNKVDEILKKEKKLMEQQEKELMQNENEIIEGENNV